MRTQTLLLVIGYLFFSINLIYAQSISVIGTGTNNSDSAPLNRYYNYSISEMIYTATEINSSGNITKLAFQKGTGNSSVTIDDLSIYLKTTTTNSLSSGTTDTTGYTLVWAGNFPNNLPNGWAEIVLNSPFSYNGTDNLQILVLKGNQTYSSSRPYYNYTATNPNKTRSYANDSAPWAANKTLSESSHRPNIRLTLTSSVANDAGITAHNPELLCPGNNSITATLNNFGTQALTSATLNWSINGTAQPAINWTGNLAPYQQITVNLGAYSFNPGINYTIDISSNHPNGVADQNTINDTYNNTISLAFTGTYSIGGTNPNYPDLVSAISDLVNNGLCGPVILELRDGTYNGAVSIPAINGLSATSTLTIRPESSANNVIITSNDASSTITLDGSDYVTIDGRSGGLGTNSALDIDNSNNDGSAVYLVNGATYNIVEHCHVRNYCWEFSKGVITLGDNGWSVATSSGGNSYNTFRYNHIRESVFGSTYQAIVSQAPIANPNTNNLIQNNAIYNYDTEGILLEEGNTNWTIQNNSFYQFANQSGQMTSIQISDGTGYTISNNRMGGSDDQMGGAATTASGNGRFTGIKIASGVGTVDIINNKIKNIKTAYYFSGINLSGGTVLIQGNEIGGPSASEKIESEVRKAIGIEFYGNDVDVIIEDNKIGNIHFNNSSSSNNQAYGIEANVGKAIIRNNEIFNITSNGSYSSYSPENNLAAGIYVERSSFASGGPYPLTIEGNRIHHIQQLIGNDIGPAAAIYIEDEKNSAVTITRNKIYEINSSSTSHKGNVWGIYAKMNGAVLLSNNQIKIGRTTTGIAKVQGIEIISTTGNYKVFYNTIVVDGIAGASTSDASFCFLRTDQATFNLLNNLFVNNRTGGTTNHYCIGNNSSSMNNWTSNYNVFLAHEMNALNQWGGIDKNFDAWKTATTSVSSWSDDVSGINLNNLFDDFLGGHLDIDPNQIECWYVNGKGVQIPNITGDINNTSAGRSTIVVDGGTDIGANKLTPNVLPQSLTITGSHTLGGTEILSFANRPVAKIEWGNSGVLPSIQSAKYYSGTNPNDPTNNGTITNPKHFNAYWDIAASGGTDYTYTLTLFYDEALLGSISNESLAKLGKKETGVLGSWQTYNSYINNTNNELYHSGLSGFSEFTALLDANGSLPVDLLSFTGQKIGTNIDLEWITSSETNNAYFSIQKSMDGINWTQLDTVAGQGTTTVQTTYNYTDTNPYSSYNYYRLLQTDFTGTVTNVSNVITIYFDTAIHKTKGSNQYFWVNSQREICLLSNHNSTYSIKIYSSLGQPLYQVNYNVSIGMNKIPLNTQGFSTGLYIISIENNQFNHSQKVILDNGH